MADRQSDLFGQFIADEDEARVPLGVLLLRDKAEELLLALVVGTVRYSVQRILMHDPLERDYWLREARQGYDRTEALKDHSTFGDVLVFGS